MSLDARIAFDVIHDAREHVHAVLQLFERFAGDDELVFAEAEFFGAATGLVVALAT